MELVGLLLRVGCVFALLFAVLHVLKRTHGGKAASRTAVLQVLGSTRLGKGAALTVVRVGSAEYVLGVTDHTVSLLNPGAAPVAAPAAAEEPAEEPVAAPRALTGARPALGTRLGAALAGRTDDEPQVPPTPAEFLRSAFRVARRLPAESTDLSQDAVTAALASVRGDEAAAAVPAPRTAPDAAGPGPLPRHALRRAVARTTALRDEERPARSCRPTSRTTDLDGLLT